MHTAPMKDSEGDFGPVVDSKCPCPTCGYMTLRYRVWESHCGGYTDLKYECTSCGAVRWVEGPDA